MKKYKILFASLMISSLIMMSLFNVIPQDIVMPRDSLKPEIPINKTTISINGNAALAANATAGNGTVGNPYIIENYIINASGLSVDGILIQNTDAYFILRNCTITGTDPGFAGIKLSNVTHGIIMNNTCSANAYGVDCFQSSNNTLTLNKINGNEYGIQLSVSGHSKLMYNIANNNTQIGIVIANDNLHTLINNTANNNLFCGIYFSFSNNNTLTNNTANSNDYSGILMDIGCENYTLFHNTANNNIEAGIDLEGCAQNELTYNNADYNRFGIRLHALCVENTLTNNSAYYNDDYGISVTDFSHRNTISQNNMNYNQLHGICISSSDNNTVFRNNMSYNNQYGIHLEGSFSDNNLIYLNTLMGNVLAQANYNSSGTGNKFDNGSLGNYYSDYESLYPTASHDGTVWNQSYQIGNVSDNFPLVSPWGLNWLPPSVEILSPTNGLQFEENQKIPIVVNVTDLIMITEVQLYSNSTYIQNLQYNGSLYVLNWTNTLGFAGINFLQIRAFNAYGKINDTEVVWINITLYVPPPGHADLYNVTTTNSTGSPQDNFTRGEQITYEATIRGDLGSGTYVVMAHTDDPTLNGYLTYNETVQVQAGLDTVVKFYFDIPTGATVATGTYKAYITVWTDWPYAGGICVDYIIETFTVN